MGKGISYSVEQTLVGGNKSPQDVCEGGYQWFSSVMEWWGFASDDLRITNPRPQGILSTLENEKTLLRLLIGLDWLKP